MKKNIFLILFIFCVSFSYGQQIIPPYNLQVISVFNQNSIDTTMINPDSVQTTDVEIVLVMSIANINNTDSIFIKLEDSNIVLFDSFILPNDSSNSPTIFTLTSNNLSISLGSYSNLSDNYSIETFLTDNNGINSAVSKYPNVDD